MAAGVLEASGKAMALAPSSPLITYLAFLSIGTSCGWFVVDGLLNLAANEPQMSRGGAMIGEVNMLGAITGLLLCLIFGLYPMLFGKISQRVELWGSSILILLSLIGLLLLAFAWQKTTVIRFCAILGGAVGQGSILLLFPLIATSYGGWLVAPVRAGTDLSAMLSAFLAEAQSPNGMRHLYPTWLLFTFYSMISACGLLAWCFILKFGIGLRPPVGENEMETPEDDLESDSKSIPEPTTCKQMLRDTVQGLYCPRQLVAPVVLASLTQPALWSMASLGEVAAEMTDPYDCKGEQGRFVYRCSLTLSMILVPLGSVLSSLRTCPRSLFSFISLLQYFCCFLICTAAADVCRAVWTSEAGRIVFIASYATCGMTEGYVVTMAYRYIGDAESVPLPQRHSAGALLSLFSVIGVSAGSWILGAAVTDGTITCIAAG